MHGLADLRVLDASTGIAGGYCAKLLGDAGADVIKVEPPDGDPWRTWTASDTDLASLPPGQTDGALFRFLHHGHRSVVTDVTDPDLVASAHVLIESGGLGDADLDHLRRTHAGLVVVSLTPFGRGGPYADRPATEFTVQAESGGLAVRGRPDRAPIMAGGRISEWVSGTFASVAALACARRALATGHGDHVDLSMCELMNLAGSNYTDLAMSLRGRPPLDRPPRSLETPSIEPTLDGYVGFNTNTAQMFSDFCVLIERPDLLADTETNWSLLATRSARFDEWNEIVHEWTTRHTTADIVEAASALRIPVAPVCNGATVTDHDHFEARGTFVDDPTGTFRMPRRPWVLNGEPAPPPTPAPGLGEHTGAIDTPPARRPAPTGEPTLPLAGVRVLDLTAWWAGPSACHMLACLGAEVVHIEAIQRLDGMRMAGGMFYGMDQWWERSPFFLQANTNKAGLTLNLRDPAGRATFLRLVEVADVVIENFTPRVMDDFDLGFDVLVEHNPRIVLTRMPAFGLDGPWRDRNGFAQTMEQLTGLAWLTGEVDDQPRIQRGPSDPNAGMHAAFATLVALDERDRTGRPQHLEVTMIEGALNAAAEQVIEWTAYGHLLQREGNRAPTAAPQGLYRAPGFEAWLCVSVETDEQWRALATVVGRPDWLDDERLTTRAGRRHHQDELDAHLAAWAADRPLGDSVATLVDAGVPAAPARDPRESAFHPQMRARGYFEDVEHPVVGVHPIPTLPFRLATVEHWIRTPAPTVGQHSAEVLRSWIGLDDADLAALGEAEVIGTHPKGL